MFVFWEECKYILRGRFLWIAAILGMVFAVYYVNESYRNLGEEIYRSYRFTEQNGVSFEEKDIEKFLEGFLEDHCRAQDLKNELKAAGIQQITAKDILDYAMERESAFTDQLMEIQSQDDEAFSEIVNDLFPFVDIAYGALRRNLEEYDVMEQGEILLESRKLPVSGWKRERLLDGFRQLEKRAREITENGENQQFLPYSLSMENNIYWFSNQFSSNGALGFVWAFSMVLAGIIAARSLGSSYMNHMSGVLYCGKPGRRLALKKTASVLAMSGLCYLVLSLLATGYCVFMFRLDLYWDVPLASMIQYAGPLIPRFPVTIGGYWWFQMGVGLASVLILALLFSGVMVLTKSFYAGSAISVGIPLLLLGVILSVPEAQNWFLLMGSPVGLFLNAGKFLRQDFLFSILPHFEGMMLLIWAGRVGVLAALGFVRFRRTAL